MTNPLKGETQVDLAGDSYKARLTIDAIMRLEEATGVGVIRMANQMGDADISMSHIVHVLHQGLRGGGNDLTLNDVKKLVGSSGVLQAAQACGAILTAALSDQSDEGSDEKKDQ